jgi:type I restriction enzyme, S subunit
MKRAWELKPFESCIAPVEYTRKIQRKDFLTKGQFPVVSQEAEFTNGFWDDEADVFKVATPVVIFGDHTQVLKYVDFDFVLGADGVKVLQPHSFLNPKFFFYQLQAAELPSLGYARHYRLLKELDMGVPPLPEQKRIVSIIDEAFAGLATAKANAEKNLQNARALFESQLEILFSNTNGWTQKHLADVAKVFGRGKSRHRPRNEPKLYGGKYPFIQTGDVRNADRVVETYSQTYSEMGFAQSKLWPAGAVCITIAANIAETAILGFDACIPDSIIGFTPDETKADNRFVLYLLRSFKAHLQSQGKGSAQDNINMGTFEDQLFPFPPVDVQQNIADRLDSLAESTKQLASVYEQKLAALEALKKSLLHHAFTGQL